MIMRMFSRFIPSLCFVIALSTLWPGTTRGDEWPSRPIKLVVSLPAGGVIDFVGREIAQSLSNVIGQPVVVDNKPGGGGAIAATFVAKTRPDGYTLLVTANGPAVIRPILEQKSPIDMEAEFEPVIIIGELPNILIANGKHDFKTVQDVIAYAKQKPGQLTIGHPGVGTVGHLVALLFAAETGIQANFIAYRGAAPLMTDLLGERIDLGSIALTPGLANVRFLVNTSNEKLPSLPNVPTTKEIGLPNVVGTTWIGIFAPKGTPPRTISTLNSSIEASLEAKSTKNKFDKIGFRIIGGSADQMRTQMAHDHDKWAKIIQASKVSINQ